MFLEIIFHSSTFCNFIAVNTSRFVDFAGLSVGDTSSTISVVSVLSFGRIASENFTQAWYS